MVSEKPDTVTELRRVALATMAERGIDGATVQMVADAAGCAKSNVLYHFGSKQGLVEAALAPVVVAIEHLVAELERVVAAGGSIADPEPAALFTDTLIEHRLGANLVLNRLGELPEGVVRDRLLVGIERIRALVEGRTSRVEDELRVAIVLGGLAFALAGPMAPGPDVAAGEIRPLLIRVAQDMLAPAARSAAAIPVA